MGLDYIQKYFKALIGSVGVQGSHSRWCLGDPNGVPGIQLGSDTCMANTTIPMAISNQSQGGFYF